MIEEAHLDELLQIVRDVGAEIIAARTQLAGSELFVADIVQQQRLNRIDVGAATAVELILDDIKQTPMQTLDQRECFEIVRANMVEARLVHGGLDRLDDGFHDDAFPKPISFSRRALSPSSAPQ